LEILRYLIEEKKLDYSVLSIIDNNKFESNLEVACRWGQLIIVKYLLCLPSYNFNISIDKNKINQLLCKENFLNEISYSQTYSIDMIDNGISVCRNKTILKILKNYKKKYFDKNYCI